MLDRQTRRRTYLAKHAVARILGVLDRETGPSHHRFEEPAERRVFVPDMFLKFVTAVVDRVPKPKHASWSQPVTEPCEGDAFPEVGKMMEGIGRRAGRSLLRDLRPRTPASGQDRQGTERLCAAPESSLVS